MRVLRNARQLKSGVFDVLDEQDDEDFVDMNQVEVADPRSDFIDVDFNSEIVFNAQTTIDDMSMILPAQTTRKGCSSHDGGETRPSKRAVVERAPPTSRQKDKKPRAETTTPEGQRPRRKKRTLIQRMKRR